MLPVPHGLIALAVRPPSPSRRPKQIRSHRLLPCAQDPSDKRYILADEALKSITGEERFLAFGCQKLLAKHIIKL